MKVSLYTIYTICSRIHLYVYALGELKHGPAHAPSIPGKYQNSYCKDPQKSIHKPKPPYMDFEKGSSPACLHPTLRKALAALDQEQHHDSWATPLFRPRVHGVQGIRFRFESLGFNTIHKTSAGFLALSMGCCVSSCRWCQAL